MTKQDAIIKCLNALLEGKKVYAHSKYNPNPQHGYPLHNYDDIRCFIGSKEYNILIQSGKNIYTTKEFIEIANLHVGFGYLKNKSTGTIYHIDRIHADDTLDICMYGTYAIKELNKVFTFIDDEPIETTTLEEINYGN